MNKFRNAQNSRYLKALFFEQTLEDKSTVLYTLKDTDHLGYPSLYRLYMETEDPTEWKFATAYLDGWEHWEMLCSCTWFKPYAERWRKELSLKIRSEALNRLRKEAKAGTRDSFSANKYLLEKAWEPSQSPSAKRGRPSKEDIKKAADELLDAEKRISDDALRLTLSPMMN